MRSQRNALAIPFLLALAGPAAQAEELKLLFPLGRKAYRTDESIDVAAVRSGDAALPAGELGLVLSGEDGSRIALSFPVAPAPLEGGSARRTEHLRIDARLLRPGGYAVEAAAGGVRASERIEVFSSLRRSTFRLIDWGSRAQGADLAKLGEEGLGFNLIFGEYRLDRSTANVEATLRGGADYMQCCTMGGGHTRAKLLMAYLASKIIHVPFSSIVEEDIVDGTLAANHKAVVLAGIDDLEAPAHAALEAYARSGGLVLVTADSLVEVKGASRLDAPADPRQHKLVEELWKTDQKESMRERSAARFLKAAAPLARALKEKLSAAGIRPVLECDAPAVVASRHMRGDVEYLFAVNATPDESSESFLAIRAATAALGFPADGRPIYDAVRGGPVAELAGGARKAAFRFGPGELRAFALTARPIGAVRVGAPAIARDSAAAADPIPADAAACVVDEAGGILSGAVPLRLRLLDPLGAVRHDLYRAADLGVLRIGLPLAANDPAGAWTLEATELLSGKKGTAAFAYAPPASCGALAGAQRRAVLFGADRDKVFRFFRRHASVTIVKGSSAFCAEAAGRIAQSLKPWGVRCSAVDASSVDKPRELTAEEAGTWVGLEFGRAEPGTKNGPGKVGFAIEGPAILLGSPKDNPLIEKVEAWGFLPYRTGPDFPGRGRGYIAWQRDAVGIGIESIALIASDPEGMAEAAGTADCGGCPPRARSLCDRLPLVPGATHPKRECVALAQDGSVPDRRLHSRPKPDPDPPTRRDDGFLRVPT